MFWFPWAIAGAIIGWLTEAFFTSGEPRHSTAQTASISSDYEARSYFRAVLPVSLLVIALLFAAAHHFNWLHNYVYLLEDFVFGPRVVSLSSGVAIGFWISRYRPAIVANAREFYRALLGTEKKSSWALQSAVAIMSLLGIILALKPDLLEHLQSVKAGDVEAKFSGVSAITREAVRVNLADFRTSASTLFDDYIDFRVQFLQPRDEALQLDTSTLKNSRVAIRDILLEYIEPLALLISCFEKNDRLDTLRKSEAFVRTTIDLRNSILYEDGSGRSITNSSDPRSPRSFFELLNTLLFDSYRSFHKERLSFDDRCDKKWFEHYKVDDRYNHDSVEERTSLFQNDLMRLRSKAAEATANLKQTAAEKEFWLSFLDPYITDFVAELINMTLGSTEKAKFLLRIKDGYPHPGKHREFIQSGTLNLYFQLSDAMLWSDASWPLGDVIEYLDQAVSGTEFVHEKIRKEEYNRVYYRNNFMYTKKYLEIYSQSALGRGVLSRQDRAKWVRYYQHIENVLALRGFGAPKMSWPDIAVESFTREELSNWKTIDISAGREFNARVSLALSAILLTEKNGSAPGQACTVARFHTQTAKDQIEPFTSQERMDATARARLHGFLQQVDSRVEASC
jgi:hypothetical protein